MHMHVPAPPSAAHPPPHPPNHAPAGSPNQPPNHPPKHLFQKMDSSSTCRGSPTSACVNEATVDGRARDLSHACVRDFFNELEGMRKRKRRRLRSMKTYAVAVAHIPTPVSLRTALPLGHYPTRTNVHQCVRTRTCRRSCVRPQGPTPRSKAAQPPIPVLKSARKTKRKDRVCACAPCPRRDRWVGRIVTIHAVHGLGLLVFKQVVIAHPSNKHSSLSSNQPCPRTSPSPATSSPPALVYLHPHTAMSHPHTLACATGPYSRATS